MKRFRLVAVGGTFDIVHRGHRALLDLAFSISEYVIIGVSSDEFAYKRGKNIVNSYEVRVKNLQELLDKLYKNRYSIVKLDDEFGPTLESEDIEGLIVSKETESKGKLINKLRLEKGLRPLELITIDMVFANDGKPISSTRIRKGEIDIDGNLRSL